MKPTQFSRQGNTFSKRVLKRLIDRGLTVKGLSELLRPIRPRSTVSTAIHSPRFPLVRKQIQEALGL